ncbi:MAG: hypothetical protein JNK76_15790 [Planctomycetales bacterium]|nr:hypothetical protein [Planctomycetales bacterium]MBN8628393.1 hypothetical protein [Planctomycetota bacterium]
MKLLKSLLLDLLLTIVSSILGLFWFGVMLWASTSDNALPTKCLLLISIASLPLALILIGIAIDRRRKRP